MTKVGMKRISQVELRERLNAIGYKLGGSFCYINKLNGGRVWKAKSINIIHKLSGKSFANIDACKENLPELQEIRFNCFTFEAGRIWEI